MTRDQVLELIYSARSRDDVAAAWKAQSEWLSEHPDDTAMVDLGSFLCRLETALEHCEPAKVPVTQDHPGRRVVQTAAKL